MRRSRFYRKRRVKPKTSALSVVPTEVRQSPAHSFHVRKVQAQLIVDPGVGRPKQIFDASVILNEIMPDRVMLFAEVAFPCNLRVTLNIPQVRNFFVKGKVTACKELNLNPGVLSAKVYRYRVELAYEFRSEEERKAVREYCAYLATEFLDAA